MAGQKETETGLSLEVTIVEYSNQQLNLFSFCGGRQLLK